MKKFIFAFVLCFAVAASTQANDWYNYMSKDDMQYFIDKTSIHMVENRNALFDIKVEFSKAPPLKAVVWTERVDCVKGTYRAEKETIYLDDGSASIPALSIDTDRIAWKKAVRNSIVDVLCTTLFDISISE
jgi:hypothetical protein